MTFHSDALSRCVGCGLCLPACPTFQVTHAEQYGPRGRIAGMRMVQRGEIDGGDAFYVESMETCVQCRACEPACPSGVQFGMLMEEARAALYEARTQNSVAPETRDRVAADEQAETAPPHARDPAALRARLVDAALDAIASRPTLRAASAALAVAQALRLDGVLPPAWWVVRRIRLRDVFTPLHAATAPRRFSRADASQPGSRDLPGRRSNDPNRSSTAYLFRGCVMDAWFRPVHQAAVRVLAAAGYSVNVEPAPSCCGALHLHAGRVDRAKALARDVVRAFANTEGDIIVDSAGCGAAMREYDRLLGTAEAKAFALRVRDFSEAVVDADLPPLHALDTTVVYQAACHLKNVQRVDAEAERLLCRIPSLRVVRPSDGELCCGAGGAYSLIQPELALRMRESKRQALEETGASMAVSGNPGCILHLQAAGVNVVHIAEVIASALPTEAATAEADAATAPRSP